MNSTMILASTIREGEVTAEKRRVPKGNVITPRSTERCRGRRFHRLIIAGPVALTRAQLGAIVPTFKGDPDITSRLAGLLVD